MSHGIRVFLVADRLRIQIPLQLTARDPAIDRPTADAQLLGDRRLGLHPARGSVQNALSQSRHCLSMMGRWRPASCYKARVIEKRGRR